MFKQWWSISQPILINQINAILLLSAAKRTVLL